MNVMSSRESVVFPPSGQAGARFALFAEKGLDSVRIDEITDRADLGKGTLHCHFRNRQRITREVIRTVIDGLVTRIKERASLSEGLPDFLEALITAHIEFFANRWGDFVLCFQGRSDLILEVGKAGLDTPYMRYIECVERLLSKVMSTMCSSLCAARSLPALPVLCAMRRGFQRRKTERQRRARLWLCRLTGRQM